MTTDTEIVNVALRRIGAARISSLDNDSAKEAVAARDLYHEARRDLLSLHTWNFAIKRRSISASATSPTFGWTYAYEIPEDFIRLISVHPTNDDRTKIEYRLEFQSSLDRIILCDAESPIYIRYIWDLQDPNLMTPTFRDALSLRLARDLAMALSKSAAAADLASRELARVLSRAKSIDGIEDWPEKMDDGSWIKSRFQNTSEREYE